MRTVVQNFPNLEAFGQLRSERSKGKPRIYLGPGRSKPFKNKVLSSSANKDKVDGIFQSLQQVVQYIKQVEKQAGEKVRRDDETRTESKIDLSEESTPDIVSGCRCFCNKQISEICLSFSEEPVNQPQGKSFLVEHSLNSSSTTSSPVPSSTPSTTVNGSSPYSLKTSTPPPITSTETSFYPTTSSETTISPTTSSETTLSPTTSSETSFAPTTSSESASAASWSLTSLPSTTSISTDRTTKMIQLDDQSSIVPSLNLNAPSNLSAGYNEDLALSSNLTVIFPKKTYQTVQAYTDEGLRKTRSITNIPMLSEEERKLKEEKEALNKYSLKILSLEEDLKRFGMAEDATAAGEGVVGVWLQKLFWFSNQDLPFRTSRFGDNVEALLETVGDEDKTFFILWKLLERFTDIIPGFQNEDEGLEELCARNVFRYFPQVLLRKSSLFKDDINFEKVSSLLLQMDGSQSLKSILTSLKTALSNIQNFNISNSEELENKSFTEQVLLLEKIHLLADVTLLSELYLEYMLPELLQTNKIYKLYNEVDLHFQFIKRFLSFSEYSGSVLETVQTSYNLTQIMYRKEEQNQQTLNIESFGELSENDQFKILFESSSCSKKPSIHTKDKLFC